MKESNGDDATTLLLLRKKVVLNDEELYSNSGQTKEIILMTAVCFQLFCLQAASALRYRLGLALASRPMNSRRDAILIFRRSR